ncbi:hypothetical protein X798_00953 [Onchocerca flexuosa]|uniref:SUEL-type lectin domain-containing protein n=1 Tax=Onchocerca flexuosa TaxID=387005 RepID=A0A238C2V0_9BILA|nr:hypothetical protein X798_00953 [Onchocerca flexuosa]
MALNKGPIPTVCKPKIILFKDDSDAPIQKIFCEGEEAILECPVGRYIAIQLANYGRFTLGLCNPSHRTDLSTTCQNDRTLAIMKLRFFKELVYFYSKER